MPNKSRFRSPSWLSQDLRTLGHHLRQRETWMLIGMTLIFMAIGAAAIYFGLHFDSAIRVFTGRFSGCQAIGNLDSVLLIYGVLAFVMAMLVTFGEFANYIDNRRRGYRDARISGRNTLLVLILTILIGGGIVLLFQSLCS